MAEVGVAAGAGGISESKAKLAGSRLFSPPEPVMPEIEGAVTPAKVLSQATKMLTAMGVLQNGEKAEFKTIAGVTKARKSEPAIRIVDADGKEQREISYAKLSERYRKLERAAVEARKAGRAKLEFAAASRTGKTLAQLGIRLRPPEGEWLAKHLTADIWTQEQGKPKVERVAGQELEERLGKQEPGIAKAIGNLTKVYGSRKIAIEKYISQTALGKAAEQAFTARAQKQEYAERKLQALEALPEAEKAKLGRRLQRGMAAIKQAIDRPLSYAEAVTKAATGLMLYDWNPVRLLNRVAGNPLEKLWAEKGISTWLFPKLANVSMRELAARLEEKLIIDPVTGKGVRTGAISGEQIREASIGGAVWAFRMQMLPELLAQLPVISALNLKPGEIYSMLRSSNMVKSGTGSIKHFIEMWRQQKTDGDKAKVATWVLGSGVGFYLAEKLSPVIGGINPVLMADIALMRLVGAVQKYTSERSLGSTKLSHTLEMVEHGITGAFAADSANSLGERLWTYVETGTLNPMEQIKDEASLIKLAEVHPEYLRQETGGPFGAWMRLEHELLGRIKGVKAEDNPWMAMELRGSDGETYVFHVDPGQETGEVVIVRQDDQGGIKQWQGGRWVEIVTETEAELAGVSQETNPGEEKVELATAEVQSPAVHDYVYFETGSTKMVFRMDLKSGETWDSKVARLFAGYREGGIDDPDQTIPATETLKEMDQDDPELQALAGQDGVYERQIYHGLIERLLTDADNNGLEYDASVVQTRMAEWLASDRTSDADTAEGELDYGELYRYLFVGSQITVEAGDIATEIYQPYFLTGTEGTSQGLVINLTIPEGGSVLGELAKQGYGHDNGKIYDSQSRLLPEAKIYKLSETGTETPIIDWSELNLVFPGDKFVVRTGIGEAATETAGKMPEIRAIEELGSPDASDTGGDEEWREKVVRNEKGEIYLGTVETGDYFTQMMVDRFHGKLTNEWDLLGIFQSMSVNGVSVYAENEAGERRYLNSYDDLGVLYLGEQIVIVDPNRVLAEVPDQYVTEPGGAEREPGAEPGQQPQPLPNQTLSGFTAEGKLDLRDLPQETYRDADGLIYIGEIVPGMWLSRLASQKITLPDGGDSWEQIYQSVVEGKLELLRIDDGELVPIVDLNIVNPGDKIVIRDVGKTLLGVPDVAEVMRAQQEGYNELDQAETAKLDVAAIEATLASEIQAMGEQVKVRITVIDPDNPDNAIEMGETDKFHAASVPKLGIAMIVLRAVERGELELEAKAKFTELPGNYEPTIQELLNLSIVLSDNFATQALVKELTGDENLDENSQEITKLFHEELQLNNTESGSYTTTGDLAQLMKILYRTDYLNTDNREILFTMLNNSRTVNRNAGLGLAADDWGIYPDLEITEKIGLGTGTEVNGYPSPSLSSVAFVNSAGRDLIVAISVETDDPAAARTVFRTVSRSLATAIYPEATAEIPEEIYADKAMYIAGNNFAEKDYVSHVIFPYRREDGSYVVNPRIQEAVADGENKDWASYTQEVTLNSDGSGIINLSNEDEEVTVVVAKDGTVAVVLADDPQGRFGYQQVNIDAEEESADVKSSQEQPLEVHAYKQDPGAYAIETEEGRRALVTDSLKTGSEYDIFIFAGKTAGEIPYLVTANDRGQTNGLLQGELRVCFVGDGQLTVAWQGLLDQLSKTGKVEDIVWHDGGVVQSQAIGWEDSGHDEWFSSLAEATGDNWQTDTTQGSTESAIFSAALADTYGLDPAQTFPGMTIDGITYSRLLYWPDGAEMDKASIARSLGMDQQTLVVMPSNDLGVYLIGAADDGADRSREETAVTYTHPEDQLLYQYQDGTLSKTYTIDPNNPLVGVVPLSKPLETYLTTDKLVKIPEEVKITSQYYEGKYFVSNEEEGESREMYVDPVSLTPYIKEGDGFYPLVGHNWSYAEMQAIYAKAENGKQLTVAEIWEMRRGEELELKLRDESKAVGYEAGKLRFYDSEGIGGSKLWEFAADPNGLPLVDSQGRWILEGENDAKAVATEGTLTTNLNTEMAVADYLEGFAYVTDAAGKPLQYRGMPLLEHSGLLYAPTASGIDLVGSAKEMPWETYQGDQDASILVKEWRLTTAVSLDQLMAEAESADEVPGVAQQLAKAEAKLIEVPGGVVDKLTGEKYQLAKLGEVTRLEASSGKAVFQTKAGEIVIWEDGSWAPIAPHETVAENEFWLAKGMKPLTVKDPSLADVWEYIWKKDTEVTTREMVERRTQSSIYTDGTWAYVLDSRGMVRIGLNDAAIKSGWAGYLDEQGEYQTLMPDSYWSMLSQGHRYSTAEKMSLVVNPILNYVIGMFADDMDKWAMMKIIDFLPALDQRNYLNFEQLPPFYLTALIAQENKRFFSYDEGEAANFDAGVLVRMILSGGARGGSTLAQGLIKNVLMSPEERLERSLSRKASELLMADQLLENASPENIVTMYANSVSYGNYQGETILGVERAAEVIFGRAIGELDPSETALLVAVPNYPARNNLASHQNALGWADSAAGVARHMWENGFISEPEMKEMFLEAHERILPQGQLDEIDWLIQQGLLDSADREWAVAQLETYAKLDFEGRKLLEVKTEIIETAPGGRNRQVTRVVTEVEKGYADFFQFLALQNPEKLPTAELDDAYQAYYYWGKTLSDHDTIPYTRESEKIAVGERFTVRGYDHNLPDLVPRVEIDPNTGDVKLDTWSYRYAAMETDEAGAPLVFDVAEANVDGRPIVQDEQGYLWKVTNAGLVRLSGRIFQTVQGEAVQLTPANDRPGMWKLANQEMPQRLYQDALGNYFEVIGDKTARYIGRSFTGSQGDRTIYALGKMPESTFLTADVPSQFAWTAVQNAWAYQGTATDNNAEPTAIPVSLDPNEGYLEPTKEQEFGLVNPTGVQKALEASGIETQAIELTSQQGGAQAFKALLQELTGQQKPVVVWLNNDMAAEVVPVGSGTQTRYEAVARFERPVSILETFESEGKEYVVYQDPAFAEPKVLPWEKFAYLASPIQGGRYKLLVAEAYELPKAYHKHLFDATKPENQLSLLTGSGYQYNYEDPGMAEEMMTINPAMQEFVSTQGNTWLKEKGAGGVIALAMDGSGNMPFMVALDGDGQSAGEKEIFGTYQPGSIFKLVTALWALDEGVKATRTFKAGDYYEWAKGDRTYNWTMDSETGKLKYSAAPRGMNIIQGIKYSNNPFFINLAMSSDDPAALGDYARQVGFGDGSGAGIGFPGNDSTFPDPQDPQWTKRDFGYTAFGQGPVAVSPIEMLRFVNAIASGGELVEPTLVRDAEPREWEKLPNELEDLEFLQKAMKEVTKSPGGTAYRSFGNVRGYEVYGKTGTAEIGGAENPHAWFVGWAEDKKTGERLSFVFLFPNAGEGSQVAAPFARQVLDKYFADVAANKALDPVVEVELALSDGAAERQAKEDAAVPQGTPGLVIEAAPTQAITQVAEIEKAVVGFEINAQPNQELIEFVTVATRIADDYLAKNAGKINTEITGEMFTEHLREQLIAKGYGEIVDSPQMAAALRLLKEDFGSYDREDPEAIQCVGWQVWIGQLRGVLEGAPMPTTMKGDADDLVSYVLYNKTSPIGGQAILFDSNRADITQLKPGDTFYLRYRFGSDSIGHTGVILATGKLPNGEPAVLVADSNRRVDKSGELVTDGTPRLQWMSQAEFSRQFETEGDRNMAVAASEFVVIRLGQNEQIESVYDPNYHAKNGDNRSDDKMVSGNR